MRTQEVTNTKDIYLDKEIFTELAKVSITTTKELVGLIYNPPFEDFKEMEKVQVREFSTFNVVIDTYYTVKWHTENNESFDTSILKEDYERIIRNKTLQNILN